MLISQVVAVGARAVGNFNDNFNLKNRLLAQDLVGGRAGVSGKRSYLQLLINQERSKLCWL